MRNLFSAKPAIGAALLLSAACAFAQTAPADPAPGMPPAATAPVDPAPIAPQPPAEGETPGMAVQPQMAAPAPAPDGVGGPATPTAMDTYPVCTKSNRDSCRQPAGRHVPPPA